MPAHTTRRETRSRLATRSVFLEPFTGPGWPDRFGGWIEQRDLLPERAWSILFFFGGSRINRHRVGWRLRVRGRRGVHLAPRETC